MADWGPIRLNVECNRSKIIDLLNQGETLPIIHQLLTESGDLVKMNVRTFCRYAAEYRDEVKKSRAELDAIIISPDFKKDQKSSSRSQVKTKPRDAVRPAHSRAGPTTSSTPASFLIEDAYAAEYGDDDNDEG